jgi:hypothetical protein
MFKSALSPERKFMPLRIAVIAVSDTRTLETDTGGALLKSLLESDGHTCADRVVVRDDGRLRFEDPEGLGLELAVVDAPDEPLRARHPEIPEEHALRGFDGEAGAVADAPVAHAVACMWALCIQKLLAGKYGGQLAAPRADDSGRGGVRDSVEALAECCGVFEAQFLSDVRQQPTALAFRCVQVRDHRIESLCKLSNLVLGYGGHALRPVSLPESAHRIGKLPDRHQDRPSNQQQE